MIDPNKLLQAAWNARVHAHAPYSRFQVGAALLAADGHIFTGCNIENASFGLTTCAERVALVKALSEGTRQFTHLAIATATPQPTPPCGACRQLLWELAGDVVVLLGNEQGLQQTFRLVELFPFPFDARSF